MQNARLEEAQAGIKTARRNINNLRYAEDTTLTAEVKRNLRASWWGWKRRVQKLVRNLTLKKTKIMACSPITSWQTKGEKVEALTDFLFLGSKITVHGDCSHKIQRYLLLGRKVLTNLDSILKSKDITLLTNPYSQSYGLSSRHKRMWELDYKEGLSQKNWWFWTVVLEKTLKSPLDCKGIKPVNPKGN